MLYEYPYTDLYNLNLDWMIKAMKEMQAIVEPLDRIVNSINGMTGDVQITKDLLLGILGNIVESFNGRHGDVNLTLDDVNGVMVDVLWISAPGDTLADLPQYSLDSLYRNGRRIMIFINNASVPDTVYFLKWVSGHAFAQLYSPTAALAGVASFNGQTGNVTATGSNLATSASDSTSIADTLNAQSQQIAGLQPIDNLKSSSTTAPLSANQGRVLADINTVESGIPNITVVRTVNMLQFKVALDNQAYSAGWNTIGTLNEGCRPLTQSDFPIYDDNATQPPFVAGTIRFLTNGLVRIYTYAGSIKFMGTFLMLSQI